MRTTGSIIREDLRLVAGTDANDPVILSQLQAALLALTDNKAYKFPVRGAVTSKNPGDVVFNSFNAGTNTLSTTSNVTAIDGLTLAVGDPILINYPSTNLAFNGIYTVTSLSGTSQFTRRADASTAGTGNNTDLGVGTVVYVEDGTMNVNTSWTLQPPALGTDTITLNTSNLKWLQSNPSVYVPTSYSEVPAGTVNGANTVFTTVHNPIAASLLVILRRQVLLPGTEFTLSGGNTLTLNAANVAPPSVGDDFLAMYLS